MTITANQVIRSQLEERAGTLEGCTQSHVISYLGPLTYGMDTVVRDLVEELQNSSPPDPRAPTRVLFLLETPGGYIEPIRRIAEVLRHHYEAVHFVVPDFAMSAGTVLVMSGDAIFMDYYSVLGPIDPQMTQQDGGMVSAIGYLKKYEELVEKSKGKEGLTNAELAFFLTKFDPSTLYCYEQEKALSESLIEEWLVKYKFKNWTETETRKIRVTPRMRRQRAKKIGKCLNDPERWHSHGAGIPMRVLREEVKLKIDDLQAYADMYKGVKSYFKLLKDFKRRLGDNFVVHTRRSYVGIGG